LAKVHSKASLFTWNAVALGDDLDDLSLERSIEEADVTTFSSTAKEFVVGLTDNTISGGGPWGGAASEADVTLAPDFAAGTSRAWTYSPGGASAPVYSGNGYLTSYNVTSSVDDAVRFEFEIRITGAVTRT
jgi:hypothetical protein